MIGGLCRRLLLFEIVVNGWMDRFGEPRFLNQETFLDVLIFRFGGCCEESGERPWVQLSISSGQV